MSAPRRWCRHENGDIRYDAAGQEWWVCEDCGADRPLTPEESARA